MRAFGTDVWNELYDLYMVIALVIGALVIAWLVTAMVKYRAKAGDKRPADAPRAGVIPAERGRVVWVFVMAGVIAVILAGLAFKSIPAIDVVENPPEGEFALYHNVTGFQFGWKFNYTAEGGLPYQDVGVYTIPVDTNIVMNVTSQDVWHNFAVPDYRIRVDAIPGTVNHIWFKATETGSGHTVCVMLCGAGHALMRADLNVVSKADYAKFAHDESMQQYAKFAKRAGNTVVNASFDGTTLSESGSAKAGAPFIVSLQNAGPKDATFRLHTDARDQSFTVPAGATGYGYFVAPTSGLVLFDGPNSSANIPVVS